MNYTFDDVTVDRVVLCVIIGMVAGSLHYGVGWLLKRWLLPKEKQHMQPTFQLHEAQASFIYLSLEKPSGKGWAKTGIKALDKLVALQCLANLASPVPRKDISNLRRKLLNDVEKTGFVKSSVVYISGEDRDATSRVIRRLMPQAAIKLV